MHPKEQEYYQTIQQLLIGQKLKSVFYEELDYQDGKEYWEESSSLHSVDMNVILQLENQALIQIKWDDAFYCYGVGVEPLPKLNSRENLKLIEVSKNPQWVKLVDQKVTSIEVYWDKCKSSETNFLPVAWEMQFGQNNKVWVATMQIENDKPYSFWSDHLTLCFSKQEQAKYFKIELSDKQHRLLL